MKKTKHSPTAKIYLTLEDFREELSLLKSADGRIVFTNGCFDMLHCGHMHGLNGARQQGDYLIVGLNTDESVRRLKGEDRPLVDQEDRAYMLASLQSVDAVIMFDQATPIELIREIRPDVIVKGRDYEESEMIGGDFVKAYGGEIVRLPLKEGYSTSAIIDKIRNHETE